MEYPKYFICPMSKNIVDAVIEFDSHKIGLLPTRRQIDYQDGYVNNWTTNNFVEYVKSKNDRIIIARDHAGPLQANTNDLLSFYADCDFLDIVHIDPWKYYNTDFDGGLEYTRKTISALHAINKDLRFEIGTEEAIRPFLNGQLMEMLRYMDGHLSTSEFNSILYVVIQSGVKLDLINRKNVGVFNVNKLKAMVDVCNVFEKKTKEHNGDYLSYYDIKIRFDGGLDSLNIGPELAQLETETYLDYMTEHDIDDFYEICLKSKRWGKWVPENFDISNKKKLIMICGHYCYGQITLPKIDNIIIETIKERLNNLP